MFTLNRSALSALLALACLASFADAQSQPTRSKRIIYPVKHGSAPALAAALTQQFKDDVEVQVWQGAAEPYLLINASPAASDDVLTTLGKLDRRQQTFAVDIMVIDVPPTTEAADFEEKDLSGPVDAVAKAVKDLHKKGRFAAVQQLRGVVNESQPSKITAGASMPFVSRVGAPINGITPRVISFRDVGSVVVLTPRPGVDKAVTLELKLQHLRPFVTKDKVLGKDDTGQPILATEFVSANFDGTVSVPAGQAVLVQGVMTKSESGKVRTLVIVSARAVP
jgi:hypothetical protein